jgi:radical SAM superfamily enzyme YgiQ (UPF0313 family)
LGTMSKSTKKKKSIRSRGRVERTSKKKTPSRPKPKPKPGKKPKPRLKPKPKLKPGPKSKLKPKAKEKPKKTGKAGGTGETRKRRPERRAVEPPPAPPGSCLLIHDGTAIMASGLTAMAEHLKSHGLFCAIRNLYCERQTGIEPSLDEARRFDVLGLSIHWFYQIPRALEVARKAREASRKVFIVAGGFTAGSFPEEILEKFGEFDGVIKGDGEVPLQRLCSEAAARTWNLDKVPNLTYRAKDGAVKRSRARDYVADKNSLDKLSFGNLSSLRQWHYYMHSSSWREITDGAPEITFDIDTTFYLCGGRGCSVQCAFCGGGRESHKIHSCRKRGFIFRSPARIADDVEAALEHGYRSFHTCFDPAPNGKHWIDFMSELRRRGIRTTFIFESFALPGESFIRAAANTFDHAILVISPESGVEKIRKRCKGFHYTNRQLEKCLQAIGKHGLNAQLFFGYFLPGDTEESVEKTLTTIHDLHARFGQFTNIFYYPYSTDPCSPISLDPKKFEMNVQVRTFEEYAVELSREENLRGNLLRHYPSAMDRETWDRLSLRIELERACVRRNGPLAGEIRDSLNDGLPEFYRSLARRLSVDRDIAAIPRHLLHEYVQEYYLRYTP